MRAFRSPSDIARAVWLRMRVEAAVAGQIEERLRADLEIAVAQIRHRALGREVLRRISPAQDVIALSRAAAPSSGWAVSVSSPKARGSIKAPGE